MRRFFALLMAFCMVATLAACAKDSHSDTPEPEVQATEATAEPTPVAEEPEVSAEPEPEVSPEPSAEPLPTATSSDAEIYVVTQGDDFSYPVNKFGILAESYFIDNDGNICNADGEYVVMYENTEFYKPVTNITFSKTYYSATLDAREDFVDNSSYVTRINQYPVTLAADITILPTDATCRYLYLRSSNDSVVAITANTNRRVVADGDFYLPAGTIPVEVDDRGYVRVILTAKSAGECKIYALSSGNDPVGECSVRVTDGYVNIPLPSNPPTEQVNATGNIEYHTHSFTKTVVEPTTAEKGYTMYVCQGCGYSYKDHFVSKLEVPEYIPPHVHSYEEIVVPPTSTEQGYTLHQCSCGDSYRDCFVPATG